MSPPGRGPSSMSTSMIELPSAVVRVTMGGSGRGATVGIAVFSFSRPPSGACTGEFSRTAIGGGVFTLTTIGDWRTEFASVDIGA